jgi:DNA helicase-2/ATP-dependent DNA helicase PcrA
MYASRTRFIPAEILCHFERRAWPLADATPEAKVAGLPVDIGARMRRMWR